MFEYLVFKEEYALQGSLEIRLEVDGDKLRYSIHDSDSGTLENSPESVYAGNAESFINELEAFNVPSWKDEYSVPGSKGFSWSLRYKEVGRTCKKISGSNDCPDGYEDFVDLLASLTWIA